MSVKALLFLALFVCYLLPAAPAVRGGDLAYHGELTAATAVEDEAGDGFTAGFSLRYLPAAEYTRTWPGGLGFRSELAGAFAIALDRDGDGDWESDFEADLHRAWLRLDRPRWELRLGLQKLNFGPARLLRVLRWFDAIDPNDPTGYTQGVTGLLARITPAARSTLQGWLLTDDSVLQLPEATRAGTVAGGGRIQLPLGRGEVGVTTHSRLLAAGGRETRLALDGSWDLGIGVWFESLLQRSDAPDAAAWVQLATIGLDYTFGVGNGLHLLGELLTGASGDNPFSGDDVSRYTALMLGYPLTIFDSLSLLLLLEAERPAGAVAAWGRTTDNWSFHLQGFWTGSDGGETIARLSDGIPERGIRFMAIMYH